MAPIVKWPPPVRSNRGKDYIRISIGAGKRREILLGPTGSEEAREALARALSEMGDYRFALLTADKRLRQLFDWMKHEVILIGENESNPKTCLAAIRYALAGLEKVRAELSALFARTKMK